MNFESNMYQIRNLVLSNLKEVKDYYEKSNNNITVQFNNSVVIEINFTPDMGYHLKATHEDVFKRTHKIFDDFSDLEEVMFKIVYLKRQSGEDLMYSIMFKKTAI